MVARYLFRLGCRASAQPVEKPLSLRRRLLDSPIVYATSDQASLLNMLKAYLVAKLDRRGLIRYAKIGVFQQAGRNDFMPESIIRMTLPLPSSTLYPLPSPP